MCHWPQVVPWGLGLTKSKHATFWPSLAASYQHKTHTSLVIRHSLSNILQLNNSASRIVFLQIITTFSVLSLLLKTLIQKHLHHPLWVAYVLAAFHPSGYINRVPACWLRLRQSTFTCVGWQVTLCDPIWQVMSYRSRTSSHRGLYSVLTSALTDWSFPNFPDFSLTNVKFPDFPGELPPCVTHKWRSIIIIIVIKFF